MMGLFQAAGPANSGRSEPARFSFETEDKPIQRYVRTYYVIHYQQKG